MSESRETCEHVVLGVFSPTPLENPRSLSNSELNTDLQFTFLQGVDTIISWK